jgi:hypothetical protein
VDINYDEEVTALIEQINEDLIETKESRLASKEASQLINQNSNENDNGACNNEDDVVVIEENHSEVDKNHDGSNFGDESHYNIIPEQWYHRNHQDGDLNNVEIDIATEITPRKSVCKSSSSMTTELKKGSLRLNSESSTAVNNIFSKSARKMDTQILKRTIRDISEKNETQTSKKPRIS